MADLFERLVKLPQGTDPDLPENRPIASHQIKAAFADYMAGESTPSEISAMFNMDASAEADALTVKGVVDGLASKVDKLQFIAELETVTEMARASLKYTTKPEFKTRLGI